MTRPRCVRWCGWWCALLLTMPGQLSAQDSTAAPSSGWLIGGSLGVPRADKQTEPTLSFLALHWTQFRPNRIGVDMAVGTMPRLLIEGFVTLGIRGGVALPMVVSPNVILLPAAGVSLIGAGGGGGSGGTAGYHFGVAAVLRTGKHVGLRPGIMLHRFGESGDATIALFELGFVRIP